MFKKNSKEEKKKTRYLGELDPLPDIVNVRNFLKFDLNPAALDQHTNNLLALQRKSDVWRALTWLVGAGIFIFLVAIAYVVIQGQSSGASFATAASACQNQLSTCTGKLARCGVNATKIVI